MARIDCTLPDMRSLLSVVATSALAVSLSAVPAHAEAASDGSAGSAALQDGGSCVTAREFGRVRDRMSVSKVRRVFGTNGSQLYAPPNPGTGRNRTREYRACSRPKRGALTIDFYNGRVIDKFLLWPRSRSDSPKCASNREYRKVRRGMAPKRVHRIFDTGGGLVDGAAGGFVRGYPRCGRADVSITYGTTGHRRLPWVFSKQHTHIPG
jgi:hypothetical protein